MKPDIKQRSTVDQIEERSSFSKPQVASGKMTDNIPVGESTAYPDPRQKEMERVATESLMWEDHSIQTMPLRQYLDTQVVPTLLPGLAAVAQERPNNPVEYLAHFLMANNPKQKARPIVKPKPAEDEEAGI
ncbi:unnamed protein product [Amoebophrya sp. A120]|nr:unnamed protein product [Amoebophrya sp. A120]|eukprot:GSA120T00022688001.1